MPVSRIGLTHRVFGGTPQQPQDPCDKNIGPSNFALDCHTAAGLFGWYKADTIVQAPETTLATWTDSSGSGNTLTVDNTAFDQDIFHTHPVMMPTVLFPAANSIGPNFGSVEMKLPMAFTMARGSLTAYCVVQYMLLNPLSDGLGLTTPPGLLLTTASLHGGIVFQSRLQNFFHDTPKVELHASQAMGGPQAINAPAICGWQVLTGVLDGANSLMSIFRNGSLLVSGPYTPEAMTTDSVWQVGGDSPGSGNCFEGNMVEVQLYSTAHTAATIAAKSACLKSRWGLP